MNLSLSFSRSDGRRGGGGTGVKPLHHIGFANFVWCMAYTREAGRGSYIPLYPCIGIAIVWEMRVEGGVERTIDSCKKAPH